MSRKRVPIAEIGYEDYRIVRHTHDIKEASVLMRAVLGDHSEVGCDETCPPCPEIKLGTPHLVWVRVVPALPNSWAAYEGLRYTFNPARPNSPGAFKAVEFR